MANFNAGAIESTLTLDRSPFVEGLRAARLQVSRFRDSYGRIDVEANFTLEGDEDAKERIDEIAKDRTATIEVDTDTLRARASIAALSRTRHVGIIATVNNLSMVRAQLASIGNMTLALSGANIVQNRLASIRDQLENLDQVAYRLGGFTYLFGNLSNVTLTSIANLTSLMTSLGALGGLLIPLPAYLASVAAAVGVLGIAFSGWDAEGRNAVSSMQDMKDAIENLTPAWDELLHAVRHEFWDDLAGPFETVAARLLPMLQSGLVDTAGAMNDWALSWLAAVDGIDPSVWDNLFGGIASSITIANGMIDPMVQAFATLGSVGSDNLDRLSTWFVDLSTQFNDFIQGAAADGSLQQWIDNAAIAFGDLMTVFYEFGGIIGGISDAFTAAGSTTLGTLADTLTRIHEIVDSPAFQTGLSTIFEGIIAGAGHLTDALGPIGDMLAATAPTIAYISEQIGYVLGGALEALAGAIATPAFQTGLVGFFDGIAAGVAGILPFLPSIAAGFGAIGQVAGEILANVGPILGVLLGSIADAIVPLVPMLTQLADVLGAALMDTIVALAPAFGPLLAAIVGLISALAPLVGPVLVTLANLIVALLPPLLQIVEAFTPLIDLIVALVPHFVQLGAVLGEGLATVLVGLVPLIQPLVLAIVQMFTTILPLIPAVIELVAAWFPLATAVLPVLVPLMQGLVTLIMNTFTAVAPLIPALITLVTGLTDVMVAILPLIEAGLPGLVALIEIVMGWVISLAGVLTGELTSAANQATTVIQWIGDKLSEFAGWLTSAVENVRTTVRNVGDAFNSIKSVITGAFSGARTWLTDAARNIIDGFVGGITGAFDRVRDAFGTLTSLIPEWKGPRERDRNLLRPAARLIMGGLVDQIEAERGALRTTMGRVTGDVAITPSATATIRTTGTPDAGNAKPLQMGFNDEQWAALTAIFGAMLEAMRDRPNPPLVGRDLVLQARDNESVSGQFETIMFKVRTMDGPMPGDENL